MHKAKYPGSVVLLVALFLGVGEFSDRLMGVLDKDRSQQAAV